MAKDSGLRSGLKTLCAKKITFPGIRKVTLSPLVCQQIKEQIKMIHYSFFPEILAVPPCPGQCFGEAGSEGPRGAADGPARTKHWLGLRSAQVPWSSQVGRASRAASHPQPGPCHRAQRCTAGRILLQHPSDGKKSQSFHELAETAPPCTAETGKMTTSVPRLHP